MATKEVLGEHEKQVPAGPVMATKEVLDEHEKQVPAGPVMATKEVLDKEQVPTGDSVLSFWEDPDNHDLIVNAKPLESWITMATDWAKKDYCTKPNSDFDKTKELKSVETCSSEAGKPQGRFVLTSSAFRHTGGSLKSSLKSSQSSQQQNQNPNRDIEGYIESISDNDLRESPARSVGKLFWCRKRNDLKIVNWVTAFYVGNNKIMTVAHMFDELEKDKLEIVDVVFVPAMINQFDFYGKIFGFYRIVSPDICPYFKSSGSHGPCDYDYACIQLTEAKQLKNNIITPTENSLKRLKNMNEKELEDQFRTFINIEDLGLMSIPLRFPKTENGIHFTAYGYGMSDFSSPYDKDSGNIMTKVMGEIVPECETAGYYSFSHRSLIPINVALRLGMSGGPWIQGDDKVAAGIQSGRNNPKLDGYTNHFSVSPNLHTMEDLIRQNGLNIAHQ